MEESREESLNFRVMTYNICNSFQIYNNQHFKEKLACSKRLPRIINLIKDENPDIICLQEVRDIEKNFSTFGYLSYHLGILGYDLTHFRDNPSLFSFINLIAYKRTTFFLHNTYRWWASNTPEKCSETADNPWPKVIIMATLYPLLTKCIENKQVPLPDHKKLPIYVVNLHNSTKHKERMFSNNLLIKKINKYISNRDGLVIIAGDFNSFFTNGYGEKELAILEKNNYKDALNNLKTKNGVSVSGTFIGYSLDPYKCSTEKFGDPLDHVFIKNVSPKKQSYTTICHVNAKKYNNKYDKSFAETEKNLLTGMWGEPIHNEFPSDHLPGIVDITITKHDTAMKKQEKNNNNTIKTYN